MTHTSAKNYGQTDSQKDTPIGASAALSSPLVAALEQVWAAIQHRHPEIPDVVIVVASGSVGAPRGALKLGHFAAMRWTHATTDTAEGTTSGPSLPEVFVGGEGLALGVVDVLGTLLHEATHALAHVRGIQDTSRQGRYHNRKFRDLAREMGLEVRDVPVIGWSDTHVPAATVADYAPVLERLHLAMTIHRRAEGTLTTPAPGDDTATGTTTPGTAATGAGSRNGAAARCQCGRRIRVTASVLALGPITCGVCGQPFTTPGDDAAPAAEVEVDEVDEVDEAGSASRQHYIDTGHYLHIGGHCACDEQEAAS